MRNFVFIAIAVAAFAAQAQAGCPFSPADAQAACDKCNFTRSYVQYVANPCDCNEYFSCEKTRGFITPHAQRCARCLCFSNETWGCTIRDYTRPDCPSEAPITEQIWTKEPDYCFRLGNGPAGTYLQKYQNLPPNDPDYQLFYYWLLDNQRVKMPCPPGTYFNFARCQCLACDKSTVHCQKYNPVIFCLDNDNSGTNNGIYFNQDPTCKIVFNSAVNSDVLSLPGAPCDVEVPFFQKNQFSEFTICGSFLLDSSATLPASILFDGGRPTDDCYPSISLSIDSNYQVVGTIYTGNVFTVKSAPVVAGRWYRVCLRYCNGTLELLIDQSDDIHHKPTTVTSVPASGSTRLNNCNLLIGSWFDSNGVQGFFKGLLDHWCFSRDCLQSNAPVEKNLQLLN